MADFWEYDEYCYNKIKQGKELDCWDDQFSSVHNLWKKQIVVIMLRFLYQFKQN